jgi:hypothetical protein
VSDSARRSPGHSSCEAMRTRISSDSLLVRKSMPMYGHGLIWLVRFNSWSKPSGAPSNGTVISKSEDGNYIRAANCKGVIVREHVNVEVEMVDCDAVRG